MKSPIILEYDFKVGNEWVRKTYTVATYKDWYRAIRALHGLDDYRIISVSR